MCGVNAGDICGVCGDGYMCGVFFSDMFGVDACDGDMCSVGNYLDYKYTNVDLFFTKSESKHVELTIQKILVWFGNDNFSSYHTHTVVNVLYNLLALF